MKKLLFLIILFFTLLTKAQTSAYHPMPDTNAVWNGSYWSLTGPPYQAVSTPNIKFLAGDTIINDTTYKKICSSGYETIGNPNSNGGYFTNSYMGAIRQDIANKKMYYFAYNGIDKLLYDFNLHLGDTLPYSYNNPPHFNYVSSIDSVLIGTDYRKQFHISKIGGTFASQDSNYVSLIEGIGSTYGLLDEIIPPFEGGSGLCSFSQNNVLLYTNNQTTAYCDATLGIKEVNHSTAFTIYPNPASNNITISSDKELETITIYNTLGEVVFQTKNKNIQQQIDISTLTDGIYFVNSSVNGISFSQKLIVSK
ncbi:MAG: T9SS type A sorting domain-containing protein [Bacteroidia bacterium]